MGDLMVGIRVGKTMVLVVQVPDTSRLPKA